MALAPKLVLPKGPLGLETRARRSIENELNLVPTFPGMEISAADMARRYPEAKARPVGPSVAYNCHGLTFAARRTRIWKAQEVQKILHDDGYEPVALANVLPGDVAVYFKNGDAEHSGIVLEKYGLAPIILSKWGDLQEYIHSAYYGPYQDTEIHYFRMTR